jgi:hypothetical protein
MFTKIDNGHGAKADYLCSNGMLIEGDNYVEKGQPKYYIGEKGFQTLKEAKEYCRRKEASRHAAYKI